MAIRTHLPSSIKALGILVVLVSIAGGSVKYKSSRHNYVYEDSGGELMNDIIYNDTCAWDIMKKYECEEPGCSDKAGLFNYLYIQDCVAVGWQKVIVVFGWALLLSYVIYILATTADKYFCVTLTDMVEKLGIPPSIAGVTFLSFGNGGPDVFALMSAVVGGYSHIGMGSNLGAGLFVTSVVTGVVAFMSECRVNPLSFFRDIITYIVSISYFTYVFFDKKIKLWEIIGFFVIYIIYVVIVIVFRKQSTDVYDEIESLSRVGSKEMLLTQGAISLHLSHTDDVDEIVGTTGLSVTAKVKIMSEPMHSVRHMVKEMVLDELDDDNDDDHSHPVLPDRYKSFSTSSIDIHPCVVQATAEPRNTLAEIEEGDEYVTGKVSTSVPADGSSVLATTEETINLLAMGDTVKTVEDSLWCMLVCYLRREIDSFKQLKWYYKVIYVLELPLVILRNVTIPVVMEERYNKFNILLTTIGMPVFLWYKTETKLTDIICFGIPYWLLLLIVIPILFVVAACFTSFKEPPKKVMFYILLFTSFFMSIMWVEEIADELVLLMNALGSLAGIQPFVMGLTVLAIGNSISDMVGDVTITRQGYPQMAIGGIYASPMFSLLVGLGISLLICWLKTGEDLSLGEDTLVINLTILFLLATLVMTIIVVPIQKYKFTKKFGIVLIVTYVLSLIVNVLAACKILNIPFLDPTKW